MISHHNVLKFSFQKQLNVKHMNKASKHYHQNKQCIRKQVHERPNTYITFNHKYRNRKDDKNVTSIKSIFSKHQLEFRFTFDVLPLKDSHESASCIALHLKNMYNKCILLVFSHKNILILSTSLNTHKAVNLKTS